MLSAGLRAKDSARGRDRRSSRAYVSVGASTGDGDGGMTDDLQPLYDRLYAVAEEQHRTMRRQLTISLVQLATGVLLAALLIVGVLHR